MPLRPQLCVSAGGTEVGGSRDPDVRKTVGLEVELKLNLPSPL